MPELILVALGSNLSDGVGRAPLTICRRAIDALSAHPGLVLQATSAWYVTAPIPASDQPNYVNGVARLVSDLDPASTLAVLHALEAEAGRIRSVANASRVLDLDLLAYGSVVLDMPNLVLPHPRLHERAFVLQPLCDVAPDWRHPALDRTASELRRALPPQPVERLAF